MSLPSVVDVLTQHPELAVALAIALRLARAYQTELTWSEYRELHRFKRGVFPLADRIPAVDKAILLRSDKGGALLMYCAFCVRLERPAGWD